VTTAARRARRPYTPRLPAAARRDQLLDTALAIIARDGYGSVSIEAIARELEVTRPVIYNQFTDLDDLLRTLLDRQEQRALAQLASALGAPRPAEELPAYLERTIRAFARMVAADPPTWRLIFLAFAGTPAAVRERVERDRELVRGQIRGFIAIALANRAAPGIDADVVSHLVVAVGEHVGRMLLDRPDAMPLDALVATVNGLVAQRI
jgi:AcrR family transcriptional regulator